MTDDDTRYSVRSIPGDEDCRGALLLLRTDNRRRSPVMRLVWVSDAAPSDARGVVLGTRSFFVASPAKKKEPRFGLLPKRTSKPPASSDVRKTVFDFLNPATSTVRTHAEMWWRVGQLSTTDPVQKAIETYRKWYHKYYNEDNEEILEDVLPDHAVADPGTGTVQHRRVPDAKTVIETIVDDIASIRLNRFHHEDRTVTTER